MWRLSAIGDFFFNFRFEELCAKLLQGIGTFKIISFLSIPTTLFSFKNEHFYYFSFLQVVVTLFDRNEGKPFSEEGIFKYVLKASLCSDPGADKLICEKLNGLEFLSQ